MAKMDAEVKTLLNKTLGWEPAITLEEGLKSTYRWIESQLQKSGTIRRSH